MHKAWAGVLALMAQSYPIDVDVSYNGDGRSAQVLVSHVPAAEPVAALKLRLKFRSEAGAQSVTTLRPESGPWSQFLPQAAFASGQVIIHAMAPASGEGKDKSVRQVARFALALNPAKPLASASDLVDSIIVEEAYNAQGKPMQLNNRLSTGLGKALAPAAGAPVERVRGGVRTLTFTLAKSQRVQAFVSDTRGRRVALIVDRKLPAGLQEISWDGKAAGGKPLAGGTYLLRLQSGSFVYDRKVEVAP